MTQNNNKSQNISYYSSPQELLNEMEKIVEVTDVVADIGCGIVPMNYFRPKLHFLIEPWKEYADIISHRYADDKSIIVFRTGALEALEIFDNNSVDSIFLLDVIEHLEKDDGIKIIKESERVARKQIIIFTPLGFMPQHVEPDMKDGWGLSGSEMQEHRSGWLPEDFSDSWLFHICKDFHKEDFKGETLETNYGAFFAVRNFKDKIIEEPKTFSNIRRELPSEKALRELQLEYSTLLSEYNKLINSFACRLLKYIVKFFK